MKLTGNLKKQVEATATKDEAREAIRNAGMILDDAELDQVTGGGISQPDEHFNDFPKSIAVSCPHCGTDQGITYKYGTGVAFYKCIACGNDINITDRDLERMGVNWAVQM